MSRRSPGHRSVTCDDRAGGRMIAEHLIASGRTTLGLIAGDPHVSTSIDRCAGFLETREQHGFHVDPAHLVPSGFDAAAGNTAAAEILAEASGQA
ncbi:hypothetical protein [Rhodococcus sp. NPDC057529]|uniref:hypothetical protein n=1 Tax=Rhodococcus sp. NPDC057529 TaxID=3346158 RepID=UPI00366E47F4